MRLGVTMPFTAPGGAPLTGDTIPAAARMVERAGFDSVWCFDAIGRGFMPELAAMRRLVR